MMASHHFIVSQFDVLKVLAYCYRQLLLFVIEVKNKPIQFDRSGLVRTVENSLWGREKKH